MLRQDRRSTEALLTKVTHRPPIKRDGKGLPPLRLERPGGNPGVRTNGPGSSSFRKGHRRCRYRMLKSRRCSIRPPTCWRSRARISFAYAPIAAPPAPSRACHKASAACWSAEADLSELPGIGKDLAGKIADIVKTSHFELSESLKKKLPGELGEMAALPGLGPKRIKLLYDKLKVRTLDDLRRAIETGRIHELHGFGDGDRNETGGRAQKADGCEALQACGGGSRSRGAGYLSARRRSGCCGRQLSSAPRHGR